ncbi:MAG: hypothetical protein HZC42_13150 [Candidatus Eisenbacteria bacterium]|nr:hypothetical protein [Candidatus Eisenbacteria bacterium]
MRRGALARWLFSASLSPARPGPLRDSTADVLRAAVLALLEGRVEPAHYMEAFRWRAAHVPGARALYQRFEAAVDRAARRAGQPGFRGAPRPRQQRILRSMMPARGLTRIRRALMARDEARYARHIVREVFRKFAATDAWILAGYDAWPGLPRAIAHPGPGAPWS